MSKGLLGRLGFGKKTSVAPVASNSQENNSSKNPKETIQRAMDMIKALDSAKEEMSGNSNYQANKEEAEKQLKQIEAKKQELQELLQSYKKNTAEAEAELEDLLAGGGGKPNPPKRPDAPPKKPHPALQNLQVLRDQEKREGQGNFEEESFKGDEDIIKPLPPANNTTANSAPPIKPRGKRILGGVNNQGQTGATDSYVPSVGAKPNDKAATTFPSASNQEQIQVSSPPLPARKGNPLPEQTQVSSTEVGQASQILFKPTPLPRPPILKSNNDRGEEGHSPTLIDNEAYGQFHEMVSIIDRVRQSYQEAANRIIKTFNNIPFDIRKITDKNDEERHQLARALIFSQDCPESLMNKVWIDIEEASRQRIWFEAIGLQNVEVVEKILKLMEIDPSKTDIFNYEQTVEVKDWIPNSKNRMYENVDTAGYISLIISQNSYIEVPQKLLQIINLLNKAYQSNNNIEEKKKAANSYVQMILKTQEPVHQPSSLDATQQKERRTLPTISQASKSQLEGLEDNNYNHIEPPIITARIPNSGYSHLKQNEKLSDVSKQHNLPKVIASPEVKFIEQLAPSSPLVTSSSAISEHIMPHNYQLILESLKECDNRLSQFIKEKGINHADSVTIVWGKDLQFKREFKICKDCALGNKEIEDIVKDSNNYKDILYINCSFNIDNNKNLAEKLKDFHSQGSITFVNSTLNEKMVERTASPRPDVSSRVDLPQHGQQQLASAQHTK